MRHLLVFALVFSSFAAADVEVVLNSYIELDGNELKLADLAVFHGREQEANLLASTSIPLRGKVGDTVLYRRNDIAKYIVGKYPTMQRSVRFGGAERVTVKRSGILLDERLYVSTAKATLDQSVRRFGDSIETECGGNHRETMIPKGRLSLDANAHVGKIVPTMKVQVAITVDGNHYASIPVTCKVNWPRQAFAINRLSKARTTVTDDMLYSTTTNAAALSGVLVSDSSQLKGKRLRHDMSAGTILRIEDLEEQPLVASGDNIDVLAQVGGIVVQTKAIAERDGFKGQLIKTRLPKSREVLLVEVTGEGQAIVSTNQAR